MVQKALLEVFLARMWGQCEVKSWLTGLVLKTYTPEDGSAGSHRHLRDTVSPGEVS